MEQTKNNEKERERAAVEEEEEEEEMDVVVDAPEPVTFFTFWILFSNTKEAVQF